MGGFFDEGIDLAKRVAFRLHSVGIERTPAQVYAYHVGLVNRMLESSKLRGSSKQVIALARARVLLRSSLITEEGFHELAINLSGGAKGVR